MNELDIKMAVFPAERQLHCLRHFEKVTLPDVQELALTLGYPVEEIIKNINIPGSEFLGSFASTPINCFNLLKEELESAKTIRDRRGFLIAEFSFAKERYPGGIGYSKVIHRDELNKDELNNVSLIDRDGFMVSAINSGIKKSVTWQASLVIDCEPAPSVVTLYPGISAPPLPDKRIMNAEELDESIQFWEKHIFIL